MNKTLIISLVLSGLIAVSCNDPKTEKLNNLKKETIDLHDEVMPRMDDIVGLESTLKESREQVKNDTTDSALAVIGAMTDQVKRLGDAHEAMMQWMADYEPRYESDHAIDSAIVYYEDQKQKIVSVKKEMEKSIKDAELLLGAKKEQ